MADNCWAHSVEWKTHSIYQSHLNHGFLFRKWIVCATCQVNISFKAIWKELHFNEMRSVLRNIRIFVSMAWFDKVSFLLMQTKFSHKLKRGELSLEQIRDARAHFIQLSVLIRWFCIGNVLTLVLHRVKRASKFIRFFYLLGWSFGAANDVYDGTIRITAFAV